MKKVFFHCKRIETLEIILDVYLLPFAQPALKDAVLEFVKVKLLRPLSASHLKAEAPLQEAKISFTDEPLLAGLSIFSFR